MEATHGRANLPDGSVHNSAEVSANPIATARLSPRPNEPLLANLNLHPSRWFGNFVPIPGWRDALGLPLGGP